LKNRLAPAAGQGKSCVVSMVEGSAGKTGCEPDWSKKNCCWQSAVKKCHADLNDQGHVANDQRCDGLARDEMRMDEVRKMLSLFSGSPRGHRGRSAARPTLRDCPGRKNAVNGSAAVDKPLHIHRTGCAERRLLRTTHFFSTIGASSIQSLSSSFSRT
jgi:hypothetical protein